VLGPLERVSDPEQGTNVVLEESDTIISPLYEAEAVPVELTAITV
jgi:hypothetical protein